MYQELPDEEQENSAIERPFETKGGFQPLTRQGADGADPLTGSGRLCGMETLATRGPAILQRHVLSSARFIRTDQPVCRDIGELGLISGCQLFNPFGVPARIGPCFFYRSVSGAARRDPWRICLLSRRGSPHDDYMIQAA